jgi:hypothetical protein
MRCCWPEGWCWRGHTCAAAASWARLGTRRRATATNRYVLRTRVHGAAWLYAVSYFAVGRFVTAQVSADDLAACAQHVVSRGYTRPTRMAAAAHSAGGAILTSAVSVTSPRRAPRLPSAHAMRPYPRCVSARCERHWDGEAEQAAAWPALFRVLLLRAPLTAVSRTMRRPQLPLSAEEYAEWGDPQDPAQRIALDRFCACVPSVAQRPFAVYPPQPASVCSPRPPWSIAGWSAWRAWRAPPRPRLHRRF